MTRYLLGQALELCALAVQQGPTVVVIDGIADRLRRADRYATDWQRTAVTVTDYDAAREAVASGEGR
ncbi:MAG: hypothetical protein GX557_02755 [Chloroflexi bacterium]|nr:hypothetical protein [Chloroflexota bacterium]